LKTIPAQMVVDLQAGSIDGYRVGNLEWARSKVGFTGSHRLGNLADTQAKFSAFGKTGPQLTIPTHRVGQSLLEACQYCADESNEQEIVRLSQREYVSTNVNYIHLGDPNSYVCSLSSTCGSMLITCFMGMELIDLVGLSTFCK